MSILITIISVIVTILIMYFYYSSVEKKRLKKEKELENEKVIKKLKKEYKYSSGVCKMRNGKEPLHLKYKETDDGKFHKLKKECQIKCNENDWCLGVNMKKNDDYDQCFLITDKTILTNSTGLKIRNTWSYRQRINGDKFQISCKVNQKCDDIGYLITKPKRGSKCYINKNRQIVNKQNYRIKLAEINNKKLNKKLKKQIKTSRDNKNKLQKQLKTSQQETSKLKKKIKLYKDCKNYLNFGKKCKKNNECKSNNCMNGSCCKNKFLDKNCASCNKVGWCSKCKDNYVYKRGKGCSKK